MRLSFFAFILGFSFLAEATPLALSGSYQFRGQIIPMMRRTVDVVDTRQPNARQRLAELSALGAQCVFANSSTYRCLSQRPASEVAASSIAKVQQQNRGLRVDFGQVRGTPSIVTQGDSLIEWEIPQVGRWTGGTFEVYRYLEMRGGLNKIVLAGHPELWLNFENAFTLRRYDSVVITESRWRFHEDSVEAILVR